MLLGETLPNRVVLADSELVEATITAFGITDEDENIPTGGYSTESIFKLQYKWNARNNENELHEGNYFELDLPEQFNFSWENSESYFNLKTSNGEVVAKAAVIAKKTGGGTVRITFTDYANGKTDINESLSLNAKWNAEVYPVEKETEHEMNSASFTEKLTVKPEEKSEKENPQANDVGETIQTDANKVEEANGKGENTLSENELKETPEKTDEAGQPFPKSFPRRSPSFNTGAPMGNGKLVVYDDSHELSDASNGDGTSINPYNLATMTDTLFTINYTPFFHVGDDGSNEFGDQKIVAH